MECMSELIIRAHQGDKTAREQLIKANVGLVWSIVRRFLNRGSEKEDLYQIGMIGLMKAIDHFDLCYGVKFSTYAVPMISGEIKRFLRDDGMVKVSRSLKEKGWKVRQAAEKLSQEMGHEPTVEQIAEETGLLKEEIAMALEANVEVESIHKTIYQNDGNAVELGEKLEEKKDEHAEMLNKMLIEQLLNTLEEKERILIELRYFKDKTQVETAKELSISQVQVSRLEKKILQRLRKELL